jgi:DNA-binding response OmpR family regulator
VVVPPVSVEILIVEDDATIAAGLRRAIESEGWAATVTGTAAEAFAATASVTPDLVLLDLGLPDRDGIGLCADLRAAAPNAVIVMLTARAEEIDVVVGLDAGADDYVTKPFRLAELLARLRAHLRRGPAANGAVTPRVLDAGDVHIDVASRRAWVGDEELSLRPKEFDLLTSLVVAAGTVMTREEIMSTVWDEHWWGSTKTLDIHISSLRRKLGEQQSERSRIATLRGVGYRFDSR